MATTAAVPAGLDGLAARQSSMSFADIYGASDDTGPSSAVAGSVGYASTQVAEMAASAIPSAGGIVSSAVEVGHELLDSPMGVAFILGGGLLLLAWRELA